MQTNHGPANRSKLSPRKVAAYAGLAFGAVVLICALVFLFFPDTYINGYLKNQIIKAFTRAYPAVSIRIAGVHYNIWKNRIGCDLIALTSTDSTFSCSIAKFSVSGVERVQKNPIPDSSSSMQSDGCELSRTAARAFIPGSFG